MTMRQRKDGDTLKKDMMNIMDSIEDLQHDFERVNERDIAKRLEIINQDLTDLYVRVRLEL